MYTIFSAPESAAINGALINYAPGKLFFILVNETHNYWGFYYFRLPGLPAQGRWYAIAVTL